MNLELIIYCLINFLYWMHFWFITIYFPIYAHSIKISDTNIGLIIAVFNIISLICMLPFGILTDKLGTKRIIISSLFFISIWILFISFRNAGLIYYIVGYIFGGIGTVLFLISLNSAFYKTLKLQNSQNHITYFMMGSTLGFMLGPVLGNFILRFNLVHQNINSPKSIFLYDLYIMLCILILIFFIKWPKTVDFSIREYLKDIKNKKILVFILLTVIFYSHYGTEQTSYALLMKEKVGLNNLEISSLFIILGFWITLITLFVGKNTVKNYFILVYAIGILISGIFQAITGLAYNFMSLTIFRVLHTLGDAICGIMLGVLITYVFDKKRMGFNFGFFLMAQLFATIPFSYISGIITIKNNYSIPFYFNGIFMIICSIFILISRKKIKQIILK